MMASQDKSVTKMGSIFDMLTNATTGTKNSKSVLLKLTGHEN
jgi:hypothetical protein